MKFITITTIGYNKPKNKDFSYTILKIDMIDTDHIGSTCPFCPSISFYARTHDYLRIIETIESNNIKLVQTGEVKPFVEIKDLKDMLGDVDEAIQLIINHHKN